MAQPKKKKQEPEAEKPVLTESQADVVSKLLDEGARLERERIVESLKPYYGQEKFLDIDKFIDALTGE